MAGACPPHIGCSDDRGGSLQPYVPVACNSIVTDDALVM
jgi:hypothetical protein